MKKQNNNIVVFLVVCLTVVIAVFYTRGAMENTTNLETSKIEEKNTVRQLSKELQEFTTLATEMEEQGEQYVSFYEKFKENNIIELILNSNVPGIEIGSITLSSGSEQPNGLYKGTVSLGIKARDLNILQSYMDYLTNETNNIVIDTISFGYDKTRKSNEQFASMKLGIYYVQ